MYVTSHRKTAEPRKGVILLVVLAMLALFAIVGVSFVLYAESEADASRMRREWESDTRPDLDPQEAFAFSLGQLLYDQNDDQTGVSSSLRGHSLARGIYGWNHAISNGTVVPGDNSVAFNGVGRLHYPGPFPDPNNPTTMLDESLLVNYMYFTADLKLHDPERFNWDYTTNPKQPSAWRKSLPASGQ